jgi:rRNA processing protein Krr1/Pno1
MFGFNGKEFRATITSKNVSLNHEGIDAVVLKGSIENITECAGLLRDFMASNYKIEVEFEAGDSNLLSRKDSVLSAVQNEGEVKTYVVRSRNVVEIRGKEDKVKAAAAEIRKFLYGSNDITVLKVPVPDAIIGAIIGKGGSNISKLEKENEGVTVDVNSITNAMTIRGEESAVYLCRGAVLKEMVNVNANDSIKVDLDVLEQLSDNRCIRKITDGLPVNVTVTASQVKLRGNYIDVANVKAAVEELANGSYQGQVTLSSSLLRALLSNDGSKPLFEIIQNESGANVELHEESSSIKITGKKSFVKRAKFSIFDHLESNYNYCFSKLVVPKHIAKVAYDTKEITNMAADTGCDIVFDSDVHALLIQSASSERLATGFEGAQEYVKKCGSLVFTVVVKPDESWLLLSLLTQYRNSLKELEESCNCKLDVFKEESVVSVSVKGDQDIQDGQEALLGLIEKIKCENAFVCIPESSMPQFIGQSSKHINSFAATHSVQIERVKKSPTLIRIHGQEKEVKHAATAVKDWAEGWESKHPGTNVNVDITTLEILDSASSDEKTNICRDCGVKMDVNMATFTVVIRGGKGTAHKRAVDAIEALARSNDEECRRNEPPKKSMVPLVKSQPQPIPEVTPMKFTPPMPPKVTSIPADVVVEKKRKNEAAKKKVSKLQTASNLFNFLISEDPVPTKSSDDASTVSSGLENTDDGYFRSTSGFTIRL